MTEPANETRLAAAAMPLGQFVYTLLYGGMTVLAGVLAFKQVQLWPTDLAVESGIFAFLLLVVISSTMAQLYGEKLANRIVWWGFIPLLVASLLMQLVLSLPASTEMSQFRGDDLAAFERVHATLWRVWLAGPAAYIVSLLLNVWIFSRLRGSSEGASTLSLMARGAIASALSQAIDSVIFITLAFYGQFAITNLLIGQIIAKVVLSLVLVPFLITGGVAFARWLAVDGHAPLSRRQVQPLPVGDLGAQHHASVPDHVGDHSQEEEIGVVGTPVIHQFERRHQGPHSLGGAGPVVGRSAGRQIAFEQHRHFAFRAKMTEIFALDVGGRLMDVFGENDSGAGLTKSDHLLHHRGGQSDFISRDWAALGC